jgi:hypothetical protein
MKQYQSQDEEAIKVSVPPMDVADNLPRFCDLQAMEARWISVFIGRRAPFSCF